MSLLSGHRLLVVDTETTGFDPGGGDALVEVAAVLLESAELGETWSSLMRPGRAIPADATKVHGITDAMVAEAPDATAVAAELRRRCGDLPLVFHNAPFDLPFLKALLRQAGEPPLFNPVIDTLGLARGLVGMGGNSLGAVAARYGVSPDGKCHRALADALMVARVLVHLAAEWEDERKAGTLMELAAESQDVMRQTASR